MTKNFIFAAATCAIMLSLSACGTEARPKESQKIPEQEFLEQVNVTAGELGRAFAENEVAAQMAYGGKQLNVTGQIDSITLDFENKPVVHLAAHEMFQTVAISGLSIKTASELSKGGELIVACTAISEVIGSPMLGYCETLDSEGYPIPQ